MIIYDAIYGKFELPSFLTPLLTAPEFRRLTEVRLININSPALPTLADVRRYSHTLGVLRLAIENPLPNFSEEEYRALLASIIVHDSGTPAFAHLFEYQLNELYRWNHEAVIPAILKKQHHVDGGLHQFFGSQNPKFESLCQASGIEFDLVLAMIGQRHPGSKLIFGTVDFDNLDNVARMNWMLGHRFDPAQILELSGALGVDGSDALLLPISQRGNLLQWADLRRKAYEILVYDGPTVAGQAVLSSLIADALRTKALSVDDWNYTDQQLLDVLQSTSADAKDRLHRDFLGQLPEMRLLTQITDHDHPFFTMHRQQITDLVKAYLKRMRVTRPYGYCLRDSGTFEKEVSAVDPGSGVLWSIGKRSNSLIIYGFGGGGRRHALPQQVGRDFLSWYEEGHVS